MMKSNYEAIEFSARDGIAVIRLNRPDQRNALDLTMRAEIGHAVETVRDDSAIRVLMVTGSGGAFCAGGDLKALSESRRSAAANRDRIRRLHHWFSHLLNLEKPVVAAVDGPAFGAGLNLALAADFVLATPRARFCAVFSRIGLVPDLGGFFLLPRIVGLQKAKELIFTARVVAADEAQALGMVTEVYPAEVLEKAAMSWCRRLQEGPIGSIGMAKNILNQSFNLDQNALVELEAYAQAVAIDSDDHQARVADFLAKKPARFDWEALCRWEGEK